MTEKTSVTSAIVLFAHGSRDPQWSAPIEEIARRLRLQDDHSPVCCAYLELMTPSLPQAVEQLLSSYPALKTVCIFPVFLGMGRHAREDLPEICRDLRAQHPSIEFRQLPSAGESPQVLEAIAAAASAALR